MQPNLIFEDSSVYRDSISVDPVKGTYGKLSTGFCRGNITVDPVKGTDGILFIYGILSSTDPKVSSSVDVSSDLSFISVSCPNLSLMVSE